MSSRLRRLEGWSRAGLDVGRSTAGRRAGPSTAGPRAAPGRRPAADGSPGRRAGSPAEIIGAIAAVSAALRSGAPAARAWRRGFGVHADGATPLHADLLVACGGNRAAADTLVAAGRLAAVTGAPLADVLDRVGATMAQEAEAAGQRTAALAGPRATARLLAWLPPSGVLLGVALGADPAAVLLDGGSGSILLVVGASLTVLGRAWTRRCVRQALAAGDER